MKSLRIKKSHAKKLICHLLALILLVSSITGFGAWLAPGTSAAASTPKVRIMPLGDSITYGVKPGTDVGGYRVQLWNKMAVRDHRPVNFVGSVTSGSKYVGDKNHEGHPGWRIDQIRTRVDTYLTKSNPNIVLLHIGTNDILQGYKLSTAPDRLQDLVGRICDKKPGIKIMLSSVVDLPGREAKVAAFNSKIPQIINTVNATKRCRVAYVDMNAKLTNSDISSDRIHPSQNGYNKMADQWYIVMKRMGWAPR